MPENAYVLTRYKMPDEERVKKYQQLSESLKNGYDDAYPLTVILHRKKRKINRKQTENYKLGCRRSPNLYTLE